MKIIRLFLLLLTVVSTCAVSDPTKPEETSPCVSNDPLLGDSAAWAVGALHLFNEKKYSEVIEHVDSCFGIWGPEAGQKQKVMYDNRKSCPKEGRVSVIEKRKIEKNWLMNDVSTALWAKARSLHKLDEIELAKTSYGRCVYMSCGRTWDPQGWFWSPAKDCAKYAQDLLDG